MKIHFQITPALAELDIAQIDLQEEKNKDRDFFQYCQSNKGCKNETEDN